MRIIRDDTQLSAVPDGGMVEVFQAGKNARNTVTQALPLSALANIPTVEIPGSGISDGTGTVFKSAVEQVGDFFKTTIFIDITGLDSSTTDLDIIGAGVSEATLFQVLAATHGTIFSASMTCLETPAGGVTDIDLYSATEDTGVLDAAITDLTETALLTKGGAWSAAIDTPVAVAAPAANQHIYLVGGAAGTPGTYTAGQFMIELWGY